MAAELKPRGGSQVTQGEAAPDDRPMAKRDPISEESERAHEEALRVIQRDPVLANKMEKHIETGGKDPFFYELHRKRTAPGLGKPAAPERDEREPTAKAPRTPGADGEGQRAVADRVRGGTQPNLPSPTKEEKDTLVDMEPPVVLPTATSRFEDTDVLPRVAEAKRQKTGRLVVVAVLVAALVVAIAIAVAGGDETREHRVTPSASTFVPVATSVSVPIVTASPPVASPASAEPTSEPAASSPQSAPSAMPPASAGASPSTKPSASTSPLVPKAPKPPASGPSSLGGSEPPF